MFLVNSHDFFRFKIYRLINSFTKEKIRKANYVNPLLHEEDTYVHSLTHSLTHLKEKYWKIIE